jgi:hypothetical protein
MAASLTGTADATGNCFQPLLYFNANPVQQCTYLSYFCCYMLHNLIALHVVQQVLWCAWVTCFKEKHCPVRFRSAQTCQASYLSTLRVISTKFMRHTVGTFHASQATTGCQVAWYQSLSQHSVKLSLRVSGAGRLSCKCMQACLKENSLASEIGTEDAVMLEAHVSEEDSRAIQPSSGE